MSCLIPGLIVLVALCSAFVSAHEDHPNSKWNFSGVKVLSQSPLLDEALAMVEAQGGVSTLPFSASLDAFDMDEAQLRSSRWSTKGAVGGAVTYGISWSANTPSALPDLSAFVTVNYWSSSVTYDRNDMIAVFYENANISTTSPIKWLNCSNDPNYMTTGNGTQTIYLVNGRQAVWFGFFLAATLNSATLSPVSSTFVNPTLVAYTPALPWQDYTLPMHPRLALTKNVGELSITWTQKTATTPVLRVGVTSKSYTQTFSATSVTTYTQAQMCGAPANSAGWAPPGNFYTVLVNGLTAGTKYYYTFGDSAGSMSKVEYSFVVPSTPATGKGKSWTAYLFGDLGTDIGSVDKSQVNGNEGNNVPALNVTLAMQASLASVYSQNANQDAIIMQFGDISYANGWQPDWDYFGFEIAPLAGLVPWMTGEGNHERDASNTNDNGFGNDAGGECGIAYQTRFPMPRVVDSQRGDYWSVNFNNVHFVMWDTEIPYSVGSTQWQWLQKDLASVNRCVTPYVVSMAHRPMLVDSTNNKTGGAGNTPLAADLRLHIEPLFKQYNVDVHLAGHHHSYQRSCMAYNETCTSGWGTVYLVVGTAGASFSQDPQSPTPSWEQFYVNNRNGFLQATVSDNSMNMVFYNSNNGNQYVALDSFNIYNQGLCKSPTPSSALTFGMTIIHTFFPLFVLLFLFFWH